MVNEWVVTNEPYILPYRKMDVFYQALGYDYIDLAFQVARDADPSATLIYNDTLNHSLQAGNHNGIMTQMTHDTVQRLSGKGLVDAVGLPMHLTRQICRRKMT